LGLGDLALGDARLVGDDEARVVVRANPRERLGHVRLEQGMSVGADHGATASCLRESSAPVEEQRALAAGHVATVPRRDLPGMRRATAQLKGSRRASAFGAGLASSTGSRVTRNICVLVTLEQRYLVYVGRDGMVNAISVRNGGTGRRWMIVDGGGQRRREGRG